MAGIQLGIRGTAVVVVSVAPKGPADRCGKVARFDVILEIDSKPAGSSIDEVLHEISAQMRPPDPPERQVSDQLRGPDGSLVSIKLSRHRTPHPAPSIRPPRPDLIAPRGSHRNAASSRQAVEPRAGRDLRGGPEPRAAALHVRRGGRPGPRRRRPAGPCSARRRPPRRPHRHPGRRPIGSRNRARAAPPRRPGGATRRAPARPCSGSRPLQ